jgi:hypothetical protein
MARIAKISFPELINSILAIMAIPAILAIVYPRPRGTARPAAGCPLPRL